MTTEVLDRKRILMVDDDPDSTLVMQRLLSGLGYDVQTADSVQGALQACEGRSFDVLISDIGLPDGSGCDLMRQLIAQGASGLKGIALSGFAMDDDVKQSLAAGFQRHVCKPINIQRLHSLIEEVIS